jgi:dihydroorotase
VADITLIDPALSWTVTAAGLQSKSKNSPFLGQVMLGAARCTVVNGKVVYQR